MASVTLAQLRSRAKTRADMSESDFVSDTEWNQFLNSSLGELHDLLVQKFGDDYYVSEQALTTVAAQSDYALPADFYKLLGVDLTVDGRVITLSKWQFKERNLYRNANTVMSGFSPLRMAPRYRIVGDELRIYPAPASVLSGTIYYVPTRTVLSADADTVNYPGEWEELAVLDSAIKALNKEESDVSALMAEKQAMLQRIELAAANRDAGEPEHVSDVMDDLDEEVW